MQESLVINEYIYELAADPPLLQATAKQRAEARLWIEFSGSQLIPLFYRLLKAQNSEDQDAAGKSLLAPLQRLDQELKRRR